MDPHPTNRIRVAPARELLVRHGLSPRKSLGQNFLVDVNIQERIALAAELTLDDVVVEIGPGLGALTGHLLERAKQVLALERDIDLATILETELKAVPSLKVIQGDALDYRFKAAATEAGRSLVVVGNLPYVITSPLIFAMLAAAQGGQVIDRAVLMVQKEFAQRMVAPPGNKTYGRLSVMVQQAADVEILFHVGAGAFLPPPTVSSTVVRLRPRAQPLAQLGTYFVFERIVREAFSGRRKMLRRSLEPAFGAPALHLAFEQAGIEGTRRAEELSVADFDRLAQALAICPA
jgi:16S rRNA (adenine1518-N6/adenine1519-N6)-dimethyltransferase